MHLKRMQLSLRKQPINFKVCATSWKKLPRLPWYPQKQRPRFQLQLTRSPPAQEQTHVEIPCHFSPVFGLIPGCNNMAAVWCKRLPFLLVQIESINKVASVCSSSGWCRSKAIMFRKRLCQTLLRFFCISKISEANSPFQFSQKY